MMPRRIADYPDAFAGWNIVSSAGSVISVVMTAYFIAIICDRFNKGADSSRDGWILDEYMEPYVPWSDNSDLSSFIEWSINSPPHFHAFNKLPIQG